jgi:hypothetical protein
MNLGYFERLVSAVTHEDTLVYNKIDKTYMHCFRCIFCCSTHKEVVFLIKKQFPFIFLKFKKTKNYLFVSGATKNVPKTMHVSFVLSIFPLFFFISFQRYFHFSTSLCVYSLEKQYIIL